MSTLSRLWSDFCLFWGADAKVIAVAVACGSAGVLLVVLGG